MICEYHARDYCTDYTKIENYEQAVNDKEHIWDCHHRLESHFSDGTLRPYGNFISKKELKELDMYYKRPPEELIFLTRAEHINLHKPYYGKHLSEESKQKTSDTLLEHFKQKDYEKYGNVPKRAPQITGDKAFKISLTMRSKKSIWVKMDKITEWGDMLTTRQIAELNGSTASGAVKQKITRYGYVNIRHNRYYCRLATEAEVKEYLAKYGIEC